MSLQFITVTTNCILHSSNLPWCKTGQISQVRHQIEALRKKLKSRVALLRRLAGSGWGAEAKTLRIATLSVIYFTSEHCVPVWCRSAHSRLINRVLNDAMRIATV